MSTQQGNTLTNYASDPVSQGTVITRSIMVNITGSLANLAMAGPQAAIWKPVEGKQIHVFGLGSDIDASVVTNQLRTALIHELTLLEHRSTFPVAMGVKVDCVPAQVSTLHSLLLLSLDFTCFNIRLAFRVGDDRSGRQVCLHHPAHV